MSLKFKETELSGVYLIESEIYKDSRGYFLELNKSAFFEENGIRYNFVQDNISVSKKGALRGIHFQKEPFEQAKLVTVLSGSIYDVAVDLRPNSSNFSKYYRIELSSRKYCSLYIPEGFGHGFCQNFSDRRTHLTRNAMPRICQESGNDLSRFAKFDKNLPRSTEPYSKDCRTQLTRRSSLSRSQPADGQNAGAAVPRR